MKYLIIISLILGACSTPSPAKQWDEEQRKQQDIQVEQQSPQPEPEPQQPQPEPELSNNDKLHAMMCDVFEATKQQKIKWTRTEDKDSGNVYSWNDIVLTWQDVQFTIQEGFVIKVDRQNCDADLYTYLQDERTKEENALVSGFIQFVKRRI